MTKKRYKKLLRMRGYSKYAAEQIVNNEWQKGISYQKRYDFWIKRLAIRVEYELAQAWQTFVKGVKSTCQRITTKMDKITHSQMGDNNKEKLSKEQQRLTNQVSQKES